MMKNFLVVLLLSIVAACSPRAKFSDFDYSYSRSGGIAPIYENLLIKGNTAHYAFEGHGRKIKKDFKISTQQLEAIETVLSKNDFRRIEEDYKKIYDNISTAIIIKKGANSGSKSDASMIREKEQERWEAVTAVFRNLIVENTETY